eukprot:501566-Pyramimonas_sp.AAC.1
MPQYENKNNASQIVALTSSAPSTAFCANSSWIGSVHQRRGHRHGTPTTCAAIRIWHRFWQKRMQTVGSHRPILTASRIPAAFHDQG